MRDFAAQLFRVEPGGIEVGHLKKDAVWTFDAGYAAGQSVAAKAEYGTERANGTWLLELALNMKTPTVYDPDPDDPDKRVVNPEATMAAREKQKLIKEKFRQWIFTDPDRTERLVRIYNDLYNSLRPRLFDGSHLDFPGLNQNVELRPHQKDAVWRGMSAGNTLLAHVVGAGKTFTMAATGMKMKQAGLIKKPIYVVPNHLLEQFSREFMQLYPNARLLVAAKEDFSKDKRKLLTAKIASGDWDGIIVTHSSFERIGMSRDYQADFLREQIAEYDELRHEHAADKGASRNLIKTIEKQKSRREERLKDLLAEEKKDDGLVFDELGADHIFIDEAHYFKNLETPTKMERVAGIQTGGSERAFDLYMKARFLHQQHPGHGVAFATGTPISNTMRDKQPPQAAICAVRLHIQKPIHEQRRPHPANHPAVKTRPTRARGCGGRLRESPANPSCGILNRNLGPGRKFRAMGRRRPISACLLHLAARILRPQSRKKARHHSAKPGTVC